MPTQEQIFNVLAGEPEPLHRNKLAERLGESSYRGFQIMLDRAVKGGLLDVTPDHEYSLTEAGKDKVAVKSIVTGEISEENLGTTEFQRFISLGKMTGVSPPELIKQTADHVWNGGDYNDLEWIARAFQEMGIRQDLRNRWWHSWRTFLHQPVPGQLPTAIIEGEIKDTKGETKKDKRGRKEGRSFILDPDDKPVFVGEGLGDMYYDDALELAEVRSGRSKTAAATQTPGDMADQFVKMFGAFKEFMGEKAQGKSYIVRPGEEGLQVEEVDPGKPMILTGPQGDNKQKPTYFVNSDGEVQEVQPGQPIIIKQAAPAQANTGPQYLIDKSTGQVTTVQPGQPIVIQAASPQQTFPYSPIQMKDKDGNPMVLDLSTFIRLEEHRDKQRREEESHEVKMEIGKTFKDMLGKASTALGHIAEEK